MEGERVVIIGGGMVGVATALMLKRNSPCSQVLVLEKHPEVAQGTSFQNGGLIGYSYHKSWARSKFLLGGLYSSFLDKQGFGSVSWKALTSFEFWQWSIRFMYACLFEDPKEKDDIIFNMSERSTLLHKTLREEYSKKYLKELKSYETVDTYLLDVAANKPELQGQKQYCLYMNSRFNQLVRTYTTRQACISFEPSLKHWKGEVLGCLLNEMDTLTGTNSLDLTKSLAEIAKKEGVVFLLGAEISNFKKHQNSVVQAELTDGRIVEAEKWVICAGVHSSSLGKQLGWKPPIWPVKGMSCNILGLDLQRPIHYGGEFPLYFIPLKDGVRYSAFVEFTTLEDNQIEESKKTLMESKAKSTTGVENLEFKNYWTGFRPVSSDDMPIIGKFPQLDNVYINSGHGTRGSIMLFSSAELLVQILLGQVPILNPTPFDPSRFKF
mgnify:CR=1 FL=1